MARSCGIINRRGGGHDESPNARLLKCCIWPGMEIWEDFLLLLLFRAQDSFSNTHLLRVIASDSHFDSHIQTWIVINSLTGRVCEGTNQMSIWAKACVHVCVCRRRSRLRSSSTRPEWSPSGRRRNRRWTRWQTTWTRDGEMHWGKRKRDENHPLSVFTYLTLTTSLSRSVVFCSFHLFSRSSLSSLAPPPPSVTITLVLSVTSRLCFAKKTLMNINKEGWQKDEGGSKLIEAWDISRCPVSRTKSSRTRTLTG